MIFELTVVSFFAFMRYAQREKQETMESELATIMQIDVIFAETLMVREGNYIKIGGFNVIVLMTFTVTRICR